MKLKKTSHSFRMIYRVSIFIIVSVVSLLSLFLFFANDVQSLQRSLFASPQSQGVNCQYGSNAYGRGIYNGDCTTPTPTPSASLTPTVTTTRTIPPSPTSTIRFPQTSPSVTTQPSTTPTVEVSPTTTPSIMTKRIKLQLVDSQNNPIANINIRIKYGNNELNFTTDSNGILYLNDAQSGEIIIRYTNSSNTESIKTIMVEDSASEDETIVVKLTDINNQKSEVGFSWWILCWLLPLLIIVLLLILFLIKRRSKEKESN